MNLNRYKLRDVLEAEDAYLLARRQKLAEEDEATEEALEESRFGIALSGGGIRSATINMGFLKTLNHFGVLRRADYLSTVSGGGYTGAYVQATLGDEGDYRKLFHDKHIQHLRSHGAYLVPGQTVGAKLWNTLLLVVGYVFSLVMSLLSLAVVLGIFGILFYLLKVAGVDDLVNSVLQPLMGEMSLVRVIGLVILGIGAIHLTSNLIASYGLGISRAFNRLEAGLIILVAVILIPTGIDYLMHLDLQLFNPVRDGNLPMQFMVVFGLIFAGFVLNPNAISFHRFYRNQLAGAFLAFGGPRKNIKLRDLITPRGSMAAPYPLINTCLNLQNPSGDDKFKGAKASDYFLLSPMHCGAKLTGYVSTDGFPGYRDMTLPAATTISAAAVNPGMGIYSNKLLSVLMTIFNARLGFWVNNPLKARRRYIVWWPIYFFNELLSRIGTSNKKLNISDGGHIENLAVYELLRRRCRLIIAVDAGADPYFNFVDLENLAIRARNELGVAIRFRPGQNPEEVIRPRPSNGYSSRRHAIADLYRLWDEFDLLDKEGNPILDDVGERVEVLVNYMPDGKWDPQLSLKGRFTSELDYEVKLARARYVLEKKLEGKKDLVGWQKVKFGTMVYVKSSVTAPTLKPNIPRGAAGGAEQESKGSVVSRLVSGLRDMFRGTGSEKLGNYKYDTYKYKIYHPAFPHEPTSDQFFDPVQWESYFQLGQFIGADLLKLDPRQFNRIKAGRAEPEPMSINNLINLFDEIEAKVRPVPGKPRTAVPKVETPVVVREKAGPETPEESGEEAYRM